MSFRNTSLERKLPLLVIAVLLATLATAVALAYREVRHSAELAVGVRIQTAARQLAALSATGIAARSKLLRTAAAAPAVRAAVASHSANLGIAPDTSARPAVASALHRLILASDSTLAIELWTAKGELVDSVGSAPQIALNGSDTRPSFAIPDRRAPQTAMPTSDTAQFLSFFEGKDHQVYYWMTVPVVEHGMRIGWIAEQGRIKPRPDVDRQINGLIGDHTTAYFRNQSGHFWTTIGGVPVTQPVGAATLPTAADAGTTGLMTYTRPQHGRVLSTALPVDGTPWWLVLEVDHSAVVGGARLLLIRFSLFSLLLLLAAGAASWLLIRRALRPLVDLTDAATSMAHGDYSARVAVNHQDEVGRLGASFNEMAGEVAASHTRLAGQVQEARRLASELDHARAIAVSASKAKSNFLATMSHEIRTPINAIIGYADILDLGISGPLTAEQHQNLDRIRSSSGHLLALVNDVLDLSRIEAGTMQMVNTVTDTRPSIDAAVALVEPHAMEKGIRVTVDTCDEGSARYIGDDRGVRQTLANLLSNAVKFTDGGGEIRISCSATQPTEASAVLDKHTSYVTIRVTDTGMGIGQHEIGRLFQPFTQLEADNGNPYTRERSGAGLGLSISRRLARMMNGDITVESVPQRGSTFTLWLPRESDPTTVHASDVGTPPDSRVVENSR